MIKTKKVYRQGFYIFESRVAANGNYIESIKEARQLLVYAKYFLKDHLIIYDYVITRHGWQMAVKLNMACPSGETEYWRQISERVRLFISIYAKRVNHWRGRSGTLVHSNYCRYYFETLKEAIFHLDKMRNQNIKIYQRRKKYRGIKYHYQIDKKIEKGSIFLCSKELNEGNMEIVKELGAEVFRHTSDLVGPNFINSTQFQHNTQNQKYNSQNSS